MTARNLAEVFRDKPVLITGGLGFIGSNLAIRLVEMGAHIEILDAMLEGHGGNLFNIEPIRDKVHVNVSDVRDLGSLAHLVAGKDFVFHLAGQNDHVLSLQDPFLDIDINIKGSATLLEACRRYNPSAKLVYSGTRGEYGPAAKVPVNEDAAENPKGIYELSSLTAQKLFRIFHDNHGVRSVTLRLTNIYGQRAQMKHNRFGVANWFIRKALDDATIQVFGDGKIVRDFLYVDDATEAMLQCAATENAYGQVFNIGHDKPSSFLELAQTIVDITGTGSWEFAEFTPERAAQEPGDYCTDITKVRTMVGWEPAFSLEAGLRRTIDYYRSHRSEYWT
jgi:UDP-glucose 4-epimerase